MRWLTTPTDTPEITARQLAVQELASEMRRSNALALMRAVGLEVSADRE